MANFIAIKIHYDHRRSLAQHLKYSTLPTAKEYNEYLELHRKEGVGGNGFHECLNFSVPENGVVQMYLPPTCLPAQEKLDEEFVIFSFTYKGDKEMPARIVGVHAGARILNRDGVPRIGMENIDGIEEPFFYHAEAPENLVTLFIPPIEYDFHDGIYTPSYQNWGFGLRNIKEEHAKNIITAALKAAKEDISQAKISKREILEHQIYVLNEIDRKYFSSSISTEVTPPKTNGFTGTNLPDKEIGFLGERLIYERELNYVSSIGLAASEVEWVSQSAPQSPFDIKSVRKTESGIKDFFIEVKSSRAIDDSNIYVSSRQVEFFEQNETCGAFVFVSFEPDRSLKGIRELTLRQLIAEFELEPIKYKLLSREKVGV
jgi:hypothetical protein